jgi:hypothetical protein
MAKRNDATAVTVTQTAATSPLKPATTTAAKIADRAIDMGGTEPAVIEWDPGNGVSKFAQGDLPPDVKAAEAKGEEAAELAPPDAPDDAVATTKNDGQQAASTEGNQQDGKTEGGTVSPPATQPVKTKGPEARRRALEALGLEQRRVQLEQAAAAERQRAEAAEAELARVRKLPLKEKLKWIEADRDSLSEALLVGGDDVAELPEKKAEPAVSPEVAALREEVNALKAERDQRAQQAITQAHQIVADVLKDNTAVPMVKTIRDVVIDGKPVANGYDMTLQVANQMWLNAGKAGHPRDYVPDAAERVEGWMREKRPDLAEMVDARAAAPAKKQPAPASRPAATTSIGKRTAARPETEPAELPGYNDRHGRDMAIKKEMGWL